MDIKVILLLVLAATFISTWNLLAKISRDKQVFFYLVLVSMSVIFFIPFLSYFTPISLTGWVYITISAVIEAFFHLLLGGAYECGNISLVYPISRGFGILMSSIFAVIFLGEGMTVLGAAGIILIILGIYIINLRTLSLKDMYAPIAALKEKPSRLALLTGLTTAAYSLVDKLGVEHVDPISYVYLVFLICSILLTPYIMVKKKEVVKLEWKGNKISVVLVSILYIVSYLMVLFALKYSQLMYVSSVREISVVFTCIAGIVLLKEGCGKNKVFGAIIIFLGIVVISLAK